MERPKSVKVFCNYSRKDFEEALNNFYYDKEVLELQYQPMGTSYTAVIIYRDKLDTPERRRDYVEYVKNKEGSLEERFADAAERAAEYNSKLDLEKELGNELVHE